jgi:hypothetical protein
VSQAGNVWSMCLSCPDSLQAGVVLFVLFAASALPQSIWK